MKIKVLLKYIRRRYLSILLVVTSIISMCIILIIGLQLPLFMPSLFSYEITNNINNILLNISYSYIAGGIFYFFTVLLPSNKRKKDALPGMEIIMKELDRIIFDLFLEFKRGQEHSENISMSTDVCRKLLESKDWNSSIPFIENVYKARITYFKYVYVKHQDIVKTIDKLMIYYKEFLTGYQLSLCEKIRGSLLIDQLEFSANVPLMHIASDGRNHYVDLIIKELKQIDELKKQFCH